MATWNPINPDDNESVQHESINSALSLLLQEFAATTAPAAPLAYQRWIDTDATDVPEYIRSGDNSTWKKIRYLADCRVVVGSDGVDEISIGTPASIATGYVLRLPDTTGTSNQVLAINGTPAGGVISTYWLTVAGGVTILDNLSDVIITSPANGQVLAYNGTNWVNTASGAGVTSLDGLTDVTITGGANRHVLVHNGSGQYVNRLLTQADVSDFGGPYLTTSATIDDLVGVTLGALSAGHYLRYNGSAWVNTTIQAGDVTPLLTGYLTTSSNLADLANVGSTAPTVGQVLTWGGTEWGPTTITPGGGATTLNDLTDVTISGAADLHVLIKNGAGDFQNRRLVPSDIRTDAGTFPVALIPNISAGMVVGGTFAESLIPHTLTSALVMDNQAELRLSELDANGTLYVALRAAAQVTGTYTLTFPATGPTGTKLIQTDSSGNLSFVDAPAGGATDSFKTIDSSDGADLVASGNDTVIFAASASISTTNSASPKTVTWAVIPSGVDHNALLNYSADAHPNRTAAVDISGVWSFDTAPHLDDVSLIFESGAQLGSLVSATLGGTRTWTLPDASGTIALSSFHPLLDGTSVFVTNPQVFAAGIRLRETADATDYVQLQAPANIATSYTLTLPTAGPGANNRMLEFTSAGVASWVATPSGGGGAADILEGGVQVLAAATDINFGLGFDVVNAGGGQADVALDLTEIGFPATGWTHNHTNAAGGGQLDVVAATTGTLTAARGGTGLATYGAAGAIIISTAATTLSALSAGAANTYLKINSGTGLPNWATIPSSDLPAHTHAIADLTGGPLGVALGGTGLATLTGAGRIPVATGATTAMGTIAPSATTTHALFSTGPSTAPAFRALAVGDIPSLSATYLALLGGTMTGSMNAGNFRVQGVGTPTSGTDASTKTYTDRHNTRTWACHVKGATASMLIGAQPYQEFAITITRLRVYLAAGSDPSVTVNMRKNGTQIGSNLTRNGVGMGDSGAISVSGAVADRFDFEVVSASGTPDFTMQATYTVS